ncbi:hypothetical protein KIW84_020948 [Lathyrus oleraceus]|uniref:Secreted protein n=1 Tax=Pisum sativum TaxID=3888 RepID=A0A9D4YB24_PEA|nr:hypothetical protein KIW84_020948 [Pisum sativum]
MRDRFFTESFIGILLLASSELRLAADTLINAPCKVGKEEDSLSLREDTKTEKKKMCQALLHIIFVFDGLCKAGNIDKPH